MLPGPARSGSMDFGKKRIFDGRRGIGWWRWLLLLGAGGVAIACGSAAPGGEAEHQRVVLSVDARSLSTEEQRLVESLLPAVALTDALHRAALAKEPDASLRGGLARQLLAAARHATDAELASFLELRAEAVADGRYRASEEQWLATRTGTVLAWFGPTRLEDGAAQEDSGWTGWVAMRDQEEEERLQRFISWLPAIQAALPMPEASRTEELRPLPRLVAARMLARGGAAADGASQLEILPVDGAVREETGRVLVHARAIFAARSRQEFLPAAELLFPEENNITADVHWNLMQWHYLAHTLGPRRAVREPLRVKLQEQLGERFGVLEECKAEVLAALALERLVAEGELEALPNAHLAGAVVNAFLVLEEFQRGEAPPTHGVGARIVLNACRDSGALRPEEDGWTLDRPLLAPTFRGLAEELLTIQAHGHRQQADAFIERLARRSDDFDAALAALGERLKPALRFEFRIRN